MPNLYKLLQDSFSLSIILTNIPPKRQKTAIMAMEGINSYILFI